MKRRVSICVTDGAAPKYAVGTSGTKGEACGRTYEADRETQRYCSAYCRLRAYHGGPPRYGEGLHVLRCPYCASRERDSYVAGALGQHDMAELTQHYTAEGIRWTSEPYSADQLDVVARAVGTAGERLLRAPRRCNTQGDSDSEARRPRRQVSRPSKGKSA